VAITTGVYVHFILKTVRKQKVLYILCVQSCTVRMTVLY